MQRTLLILCVLSLLLIPTIAQDNEPEFPDIIGKTAPQAEALLNQTIYRLDSMILATDTGEGEVNTVVDFEILEDGTLIRVTVLREHNVRLLWDNAAAFSATNFLNDLNGNELFTFINLSDEALSLRNIQISDFETSSWGTFLRANQCTQIWAFSETDPFLVDACETVQGGSILSFTNTNQQFWRRDGSFDIYQNGIYRGTCQQADGSCDLWLSPLAIAEDIAPYVYLIYDDTELLIYNNSDSQWMDLSQLSVADTSLSDERTWDWTRNPDLERLAPTQCLRFTLNQDNETLEECMPLAIQNTAPNAVFWTEAFTLSDSLNGDKTYTCPAASGERTICLLGR